VSNIVSSEHARWGLLHDAAEAYVGDLTAPVKRWMHEQGGDTYDQLEADVRRAISLRFDLPLFCPNEVDHADRVLLATEQRDLMGPAPQEWDSMPPPMEDRLVPVPAIHAEIMFIKRAEKLSLLSWESAVKACRRSWEFRYGLLADAQI
jgi:hypothetical protein